MIKQLIFISFIILLAVNASPSCNTNSSFNNSGMYASLGETINYPLSKFFTGYNLTYSQTPVTPGLSLVPQIQLLGQNANAPNYTISGSGSLVQPDQSLAIGFIGYDGVNYSISTLQGASLTNFTTQWVTYNFTNINGSEIGAGDDCYDMTFFNATFAVVSCNKKVVVRNPFIINRLYLVNMVNNQSQLFEFGDYDYQSANGSLAMPKTQKSLTYQYTGLTGLQQYVANLVPYTQFTQVVTNNCLSIYRYLPNGNGSMIGNMPICASTLGLGMLNIIDFEILGQTIYILDQSVGVYSFQYIANQVQNLTFFNPNQTGQYWGIDVENYGPNLIMTIVGDNYVYDFIQTQASNTFVFQNKYQLQNPAVDFSQVTGSQDFFLVQVGTQAQVYQRGVTSQNLILYSFLNTQTYQYFYTNQIFIFGQQSLSSYQIQTPTIQIQPSGTPSSTQVFLSAVSVDEGVNQTCSLVLNVSFLSSNTIIPQPTNISTEYEDTIPSGFIQSVPLDLELVGPNLQYAILQPTSYVHPTPQNSKKFLAEGHTQPIVQQTIPVIQFQQISLPQPAAVTLDVSIPRNSVSNLGSVPISNSQFGYFEADNLGVTSIYICTQNNITPQNASCVTQASGINLGGKISYQSSINFYNTATNVTTPGFGVVVTSNVTQVQFYNLQGTPFSSIQYPSTSTIKITWFSVIQNTAYVILQNTATVTYQIDVWTTNSQGVFSLVGTFNQQTMSGWPITINQFMPIQCFAVQNSLLIVNSDGPVGEIIVSQYISPQFLYSAFWKIPLPGYNVFVVGNTMLIGSVSVIQEYNLDYLPSINFSKNYTLYNYTLTPQTFFGQMSMGGSGLFYTIVQDTNGNLFILAIKSRAPQINALYQVFDLTTPTGVKTLAPTNILYVQGGQTDYVFFLQQSTSTYYQVYVPKHPTVSFSLNVPQNNTQLIFQTNFQYTITPWLGVPQLFIKPLRSITPSTNVTINQQVFNNIKLFSQGVTYASNQQFPTQYSFNPTGVFQGTVIGYNLICNGCQNSIQMVNQVNSASSLPVGNLSNVKDSFWDYNTSELYVLYQSQGGAKNYQITILNSSLQEIITPITLDSINTTQFICSKIMPVFEGHMHILSEIYVLCQYQFSTSNFGAAIIPVQMDSEQPMPSTPIFLPGIDTLWGQAQLFGQYFLALNLAAQDLAQNQIFVFQLNYSQVNATLITQISAQAFNSSIPNSFFISAFDIVMQGSGVVQIIASAQGQYVLSGQFNTSTAFTPIIGTQNSYNIFQAQSAQTQTPFYMLPNTTNMKIFVSQFNQTSQILNFILLTSNTPLYEFSFQNGQFLTIQCVQIFNNYGYNIPLYQLKLFNGTMLAGAYLHTTNSSAGYIQNVFWQRQVLNQSQLSQVVPQLVNINQGYIQQSSGIVSDLNVHFNFIVNSTGQMNLINLNPQLGNFQQITFNSEPYLNFLNSDYTGSIQLGIISDYMNPTQVIATVNVKAVPPGPTPEPTSSSKWWIALVVVGAVLVIAGIGYLIYRKRKQKVNDEENRNLLENKGSQIQLRENK